jgi:hypothetical protein
VAAASGTWLSGQLEGSLDEADAVAVAVRGARPIPGGGAARLTRVDRDRARADGGTETGYLGAGALFAALADLVVAEQYDREQAGRAVDEALKGWKP